MAESLLTGLVFTFHCVCGLYFLCLACKLKPQKPKNLFFVFKNLGFIKPWELTRFLLFDSKVLT